MPGQGLAPRAILGLLAATCSGARLYITPRPQKVCWTSCGALRTAAL